MSVIAIDEAHDADLVEIVALERRTHSNPWAIEHFAEIISLPGGSAIVGREERGSIAGFVIGWAVADEAEIANLVVAERHRRRGIGSRLVAAFLDAASSSGARRAYLEVRVSNDGALAFYRHLGFTRVGRRPRYYSRPSEDAFVLAVDLVERVG